MNRLLCIMGGVLALSFLGACTSDDKELTEWMNQQSREVHPHVAPVFPPKKFDPQAYLGVSGIDPFGPQKLVAAGTLPSGRSNAILAAAKSHPPQELEAYPLDSMTMVGFMQQAGRAHALLLVDKRLHDVKVGDWIGQNYGRITKITDSDITLRETVMDATGEWIEQTGTLHIQEKAR